MIKDDQKQIVINKQNLSRLEELYEEAVRDDVETFKFQGAILYTGYAKHLIEYCKLRKDEL